MSRTFRTSLAHFAGLLSVLALAAGVGAVAGHYRTFEIPVDELGGQVANTDLTTSAGASIAVDTLAPTIPAGLHAVATAPSRIEISWESSQDNVGVVGYIIYRNGVVFARPTRAPFIDESVLLGQVYKYSVQAFDAAGNHSSVSDPVVLAMPSEFSTATISTTNIAQTDVTLLSVAFSVMPASGSAGVSCIDGIARTEVFFAAEPSTGGYIVLTMPDGTIQRVDHGLFPMKNGVYRWKGVVNPGFVGSGVTDGGFTLEARCPAVDGISTISTTIPMEGQGAVTVSPVPTPISATETALVPPPPTPVIRLLKNDVAYSPRANVVGEIEIRLSPVIDGKNVVFLATDSQGEQHILGSAAPDALLSLNGIIVYSMLWDTNSVADGVYRLGARIVRTDGTATDILPITTTVRNTITTTVSDTKALITTISDPVISPASKTAAPKEEQLFPTDLEVDSLSEVLARVQTPAQCQSREECAAFCASRSGLLDLCREYARMVFRASSPTGSITDLVSSERLTAILEHERPLGVPDEVRNADDLAAFCGDPANEERCANFLVQRELTTAESISAQRLALSEQRAQERRVFMERVGVRPFSDLDDDGIADFDEVNLCGTDPSSADTDGDGFRDGEELLARTNPIGGSSSARSNLDDATSSPVVDESLPAENPRIAGSAEPDPLSVASVAVAATGTGREGVMTATKLAISGTAIPNAFVTLYVFSQPLIVTVKTDPSGAWSYTLEKELPDGSHEVYTAITDLDGRILAKSEPLPFVKEAAAVSIGSAALARSGGAAPGFFTGPALYALIAIVIGILGVGLSVVGFIIRRSPGDDLPSDGVPEPPLT